MSLASDTVLVVWGIGVAAFLLWFVTQGDDLE